MEKLNTLFADFNNADKNGRIRLNTNGTLEDIRLKGVQLTNGLKVILDDSDDLRTVGTIEFSTEENIWVAVIDWDTLK